MIKTKILFTCVCFLVFFFPFYTREFSLLFFFFPSWRQSRAGRQAQAATWALTPGVTKPRGRRSPPGVPVGTWSGRVGVRERVPAKAAGQRRRVARHGVGRGKQPGLPGEGMMNTPRRGRGGTHGEEGGHMVGARWHMRDKVTRWSTTQDTLSPGRAVSHLNTRRFPPADLCGKTGPSKPRTPETPSCTPRGGDRPPPANLLAPTCPHTG